MCARAQRRRRCSRSAFFTPRRQTHAGESFTAAEFLSRLRARVHSVQCISSQQAVVYWSVVQCVREHHLSGSCAREGTRMRARASDRTTACAGVLQLMLSHFAARCTHCDTRVLKRRPSSPPSSACGKESTATHCHRATLHPIRERASPQAASVH